MTTAVSLAQGAANNVTMRNRIINGAMMIDQRNAGASFTPTTSAYTLDRWQANISQSSKFSVQQNAGSITPPSGFSNYLGCTSLSAYSVLTTDTFTVGQYIEGLNVADLGWGTANAQTVTISFWVRSSLTGTFGGSVVNGGVSRSYPFTYTISSANTWEQKTITVAGDTTGTWLTTNGVGLRVFFGLGVGSTFCGTAGAWAGADYRSATGAVSVVGTSGATFYITGVQLEKGTAATPFEQRLYGTELALCQRYYYRISHATSGKTFGIGQAFGSSAVGFPTPLPVTMRTAPTSLEQNGTAANYAVLTAGGGTVACSTVPALNTATNADIAWTNFVVASGLVAGNAAGIWTAGPAYLGWSVEL